MALRADPVGETEGSLAASNVAGLESTLAAICVAQPPWANADALNGEPDNSASSPLPDEPQEVGLRRMREAMWGPVTDEEYRHRLKFGSVGMRAVQVTEVRPKIQSLTKLRAARKKAWLLGDAVRSEAFDDWISRCVISAQRPTEWTQASVLYESYLRQAGGYGSNRGDRRLAIEELATETRWGKMMGALFPNKRRRRQGWYYPVRLKKGA
jgi:hypothetical protein